MAALSIRPDLAEKLENIAREENRSVNAILEEFLAQYESSDVEKSNQDDSYRQMRHKLYQIARDYWQRNGDKTRLALTDTELDEQFWLIDHEGIPRLKSEQSQVDLPTDPLEAMVGMFDDEVTDLSSTVRETLASKTHPEYGWTNDERTD